MLVWFNLIDFESYANSARDIKLTGIGLLKAVDQPAEMIKLGKKLKLVNQFHRRKLELAANELFYPMPNVNVNPGKLDNLWVVRWLDDIGMPQYKDSFARAGVDGRMLNNLTLSELQTLGITLEMHYSSFRRAIELLRRVNFEDDYSWFGVNWRFWWEISVFRAKNSRNGRKYSFDRFCFHLIFLSCFFPEISLPQTSCFSFPTPS